MKISIVIPHYNGYAMLGRCLDSVRLQDFSDYETIVIDNGSSDGSSEYIRKNYSEVILIENDKNLGFDKAVNQGIQASSAEYVLLLNNDTLLFPDFLGKMLSKMENTPKCFSVASHMLRPLDGMTAINSYAGHDISEFLNDNCGDLYTLPGWAFSLGSKKKASKYMKEHHVFSSCAGAALYRKEYLNKTGLFDESFFAYREDIDICFRGRIMGYKIAYAPDALVIHLGSATSGGKYSSFKQFHGTRNSIYMHYKEFPTLLHIINLPFFTAGHIIKLFYFILRGFGKDYVKGIASGIKDIFKGKVKKNTFYLPYLKNYLLIELDLFINIFRVFMDRLM